MLAMLAIAVALTSPEKYVATIPVCTNLIEGRVMGPDGDYDTMRAEDVAWLWEAVNERHSMGVWSPRQGIDSRSGRDMSYLNTEISLLTNRLEFCVIDKPPKTTVVGRDGLAYGEGVTNNAFARLFQAGAEISRWPYWPDAASIQFVGSPSFGTATAAFAMFSGDIDDRPQKYVNNVHVYHAAVGTYTLTYSNVWTYLTTEVRNGFPELAVNPDSDVSISTEFETNSTATVLYSATWAKEWGNHYMWSAKFDNSTGFYVGGHWSSAVTHKDYTYEASYGGLALYLGALPTNSAAFLKRSDGKALLTLEISANREDVHKYLETGSSNGAGSWHPDVSKTTVTTSSNLNVNVICWADVTYVGGWYDDGIAMYRVDDIDVVIASAIGAVTDFDYFHDCDTSYKSSELTQPPGDAPPGWQEGASWTADESMRADCDLAVELVDFFLVLETNFPAIIVKDEDSSEGGR